jgi:hypothetical protein
VKDGVGEYTIIVAGEATIYGDDGANVELRPGLAFLMPNGWAGRWEIRETIRKHYLFWLCNDLASSQNHNERNNGNGAVAHLLPNR